MLTKQNLTLSGTTDVLPGVPVTTAVDTAVGEVLTIHDRLINRGVLMPVALTAAVEQLRQAVRLESSLPQQVPLMNVRVLDRGDSVTSIAAVRTVTIPAICPRCSGPRSQDLVELHSWIHGIEMVYDQWVNPCGHVDSYAAVLVEARRFNELVRGGA